MLVVSPFVAYAIWRAVEERRLDRAFDAIEARGEWLDTASFELHPSTAEQRQASHYYAQAMDQVGDDWPPFRTAAKSIEELCVSTVGDSSRAAALAALRPLEDHYGAALALLDRATPLDAWGWDAGDQPRDYGRLLRRARLPWALQLRAARLACTGDGDGAAASLIGVLRLRRVPGALLGMTGSPLATRHTLQSLLTFTSPSATVLERLQHEYQAAIDDRQLEAGLLVSRAQWLSSALPGELSDPPSGYLDRRIGLPEAFLVSLTRPLRSHSILTELAEYDDALAAAKQPWPDKLAAAAAIARKYQTFSNTRPRWGIWAALASPFGVHAGPRYLAQAAPLAAETLARTRASIAALAVARYQRANGALPATLADLVPAYLEAPLLDPFTAAPLVYRPDGKRYKVYSVGINRKDDGGAWDSPSDLQTGRRGNPLDVGIAAGAAAVTR
ncbi:MAG: hypothetical protein ABJC89_04540 [Acidobacteriota bacterium]